MKQAEITFTHPDIEDGAAIAQLVREVGGLEPNTTYAYLLLCEYFKDACLIARCGGELIGVVLGFRVPQRPNTLFIWQIGVARRARGTGLGSRLLDELLARPALAEVNALELTIAPSNEASNRLFDSLALRRGFSIARTAGFEARHFGRQQHERELLVTLHSQETHL